MAEQFPDLGFLEILGGRVLQHLLTGKSHELEGSWELCYSREGRGYVFNEMLKQSRWVSDLLQKHVLQQLVGGLLLVHGDGHSQGLDRADFQENVILLGLQAHGH